MRAESFIRPQERSDNLRSSGHAARQNVGKCVCVRQFAREDERELIYHTLSRAQWKRAWSSWWRFWRDKHIVISARILHLKQINNGRESFSTRCSTQFPTQLFNHLFTQLFACRFSTSAFHTVFQKVCHAHVHAQLLMQNIIRKVRRFHTHVILMSSRRWLPLPMAGIFDCSPSCFTSRLFSCGLVGSSEAMASGERLIP